MSSRHKFEHIKEGVRIEDIPLVRGRGNFVSDLKIPNMLHVAFLRSPHAHAKIVKIHTNDARALDGVVEVFKYADIRPYLTSDKISLALPSGYLKFDVDPYPLAKDEVTYVGEPIVAIIAETRAVAEDAAELIDIEFELLPAVVSVIDSVKVNSPKVRTDCPDNLVGQTKVKFGDVESCLQSATMIFKDEFRLHKGGGHSLEGRGVVAQYNPTTDLLSVWNSTQMPHRCKMILQDMTGLSEHQIRVIAPDVGGGFGPKAVFHPEELVIPVIARILEASLKWVEDRYENFLATVLERDQVWNIEVATDPTGRILTIRGAVWHDHGACTPYGLAIPFNSVSNLLGPYTIPSMDFDIYWCMTNMVPTSSTRGAGRPQGTFVIERMLDRIAKELGIDRIEIRNRNLIPADKMPFSFPIKMRDGKPMTYDSGDYPETQRQALALSNWNCFETRREKSRQHGKLRGIGISNYVELTGRGPFESVTVRVGPSGMITVSTGATSQGQGTKTTLSQIVAEIFHVSLDRIHVICGDTSASTLGVGAFASRQAVTAGNSAQEAAMMVADKALELAGVMMETAKEDLELRDGFVRLRGVPDVKKSIGDLARAVNGSIGFPLPGGIAAGLFATSNFQVEGTPFANGCHVAELEIDPDTGAISLIEYTVVHDCGRILNPSIVEGQVIGGVVHGIGTALYEHMRYDQAGQPLTASYSDYLLPTVDCIPKFRLGHIESLSPLNPLGVKGAGEGGTIGAPAAIASAVEDALRDYNVYIRDLPIHPSRIFLDIHKLLSGAGG